VFSILKEKEQNNRVTMTTTLNISIFEITSLKIQEIYPWRLKVENNNVSGLPHTLPVRNFATTTPLLKLQK
jgi:hypothetical protein